PSEFVGKRLRKRTGRLVLGLRRRKAEFLLIGDRAFGRKNRRDSRRENNCRCENQNRVSSANPFPARRRNFFEANRARREKQRINRREIIILTAQSDEDRQQDDVCDTEKSEPPALPSEKETDQTAQPKRKQNRIHELGLIENEREWTPHHIEKRTPDAVPRFETRRGVSR